MRVNLVDEYYDDADAPTELTRLLTVNGRLVRIGLRVQFVEDDDVRTVEIRPASATVEVLTGSAWASLLHERTTGLVVGAPLTRLREAADRLAERTATVIDAVFGGHDRDEHRRHFEIDWGRSDGEETFTVFIMCTACGHCVTGRDSDADAMPLGWVLHHVDLHECGEDNYDQPGMHEHSHHEH